MNSTERQILFALACQDSRTMDQGVLLMRTLQSLGQHYKYNDFRRALKSLAKRGHVERIDFSIRITPRGIEAFDANVC
jgi:DNA-binding MarR family transcriptional regulator